MLEDPEKYRNILAITFTNKAADEMKQRVLSSLKQLVVLKKNYELRITNYELNKQNTLLSDLSKSLDLKEEEICKRADTVLTSILHNYSDFSIGTIDSFVHRIIKTFAHDLYIPVNFEVEMDENKLLEEATELLISKVGADENITKILIEFTELRTDDERSWHVETDIKNFASVLLKEEGQIYLEKLKNLGIDDYFGIIKKLYALVTLFENNVKNIAVKANNLISSNHISHESFYQGRSGLSRYFANLSAGNYDKLNPNSYVLKTINENKWFGGKAEQADKDAIDRIKNQLTEYFRNIEELINTDQEKYILFRMIHQNIYPIAVLNEIKKIIDEIKTENNILHISEFNRIISGIVLKEPIPFIYERTGEKYKHYLIDEFQDTSLLQWQNLLPLIDNSLAENNLNMIVGDGKQAIYRWRNGEVEQFTSLPKLPVKTMTSIVREREMTLERNYYSVDLDKNYRSGKLIVEFNNKFFSFIANRIEGEYKSVYDNLSQKPKDDKEEGYVQVEFIDNSETEETFEEANQIKAKEIIRELLEDDYQLKDIAILCRSNRNASLMAEYLLKEGIDVVSSESLLLAKSPVVNFLIACIKYINKSDDNVSKAEIITYLKEYTDILQKASLHDTLHLLINNHERRINLSEHLKKEGIDFNISGFVNLTIYDLCETLIRLFNINETAHVNPSVSFFLNAAHEYTTRNKNNIPDFLEWWEEKKNKLSLVVPDELNAVKIMTIHKAKGLQFPVVIYPFASERLKNTKDWLWVDVDEKELPEMKAALLRNMQDMDNTKYAELYKTEASKSYLDMVNLLYVTMTRPEERIYVLTRKPSKDSIKMNSVADIFAEYFKSTEQWTETDKVYSFGNKEKRTGKRKASEYEACSIAKLISNDWKKEIIIRGQAPEFWNTEEPQKQRDFENIVHSVLSKIKYTDELDNALDNLLIEGVIDENEKTHLKEYFEKIFSNQKIKTFFTPEINTTIRNEAEILAKDGKIYRPDRLIFKNDIVTILEFKTGKEEEFHLKQLDKYSAILKEQGFENVEKHLIYLEE